ncbi:1,4-beta-D-glucan glucohydrolase [Abditibacteriota bacterium]|nr:1,4-beta-D-glucan glucohydrolase [Abditibacteriota bacterium]
MNPSFQFPADFVWGVAAAGAQIEGAAFCQGKGPSIWDTFCRVPGKVVGGDTLDVACDHFHLFEQDANLMKEMGWTNYRLSIAWPRLYPSGRGALNQAGLDFYSRLIDAFLERGITPWVTLFHWDLPQPLEDENGWLNRDTVDAFASYADTVTRHLGDRVKDWFTVNEIPCFIGLGYEQGIHAPGRTEPKKMVNQGYHHALLAHGRAVEIVRANVSDSRVGLVHNPVTPIPVIETEEHIEAARQNYERVNGPLMQPIFQGSYPAWFMDSPDAPEVTDGDLSTIAQPCDFLGLNLYAGYFVRAESPLEAMPFPSQFPLGDLPWLKVTPQTLYWQIRMAREVYSAQSFYVTENGSAFADEVTPAGEVLDLERREFLRNYLLSLHRASAEGFDVRGFFAWSVMDNFEWAEGYAKRFGLIHVDFETQKRTPKLSAHWFSAVCRENRVV